MRAFVRIMFSSSLVLGSVAWGLADGVPVSAQNEPSSSVEKARCMTRKVAGQNSSQIEVLVPSTEIGGMRRKGFEVDKCTDGMSTADQRRRWRDEICTIASTSNNSVQDAFEDRLGERPNILCGMAEVTIGVWGRGKREVSQNAGH